MALDINTVWEIVTKIGLPVIIAYAAYLHRTIAQLMQKLETMEKSFQEHRVDVTKTFVTRETLTELDAKMTRVLERIDDKVTRLLAGDK